ncbi:MAG: hypothetical protein QM808_17205 [Steroidobacteraceae bacterium]
MRIAKPMLLVSTPIGVIWAVVEAYRFKPVLALLMVILLSVISALIAYTVLRIRREQREAQASDLRSSQPHNGTSEHR